MVVSNIRKSEKMEDMPRCPAHKITAFFYSLKTIVLQPADFTKTNDSPKTTVHPPGCLIQKGKGYFRSMNQFFELFGGPIAVLLSILSTIVVSRRWKKYRGASTRRFLVPLLYWGPVFLMACMLLHIIQNAYRALVSYNETGIFNFYFYSLQLFGFVVAYQSYLLLMNCRKHVTGKKRLNPGLLISMGFIILTTLPTFVFTPIGIIPSAVLFITFLLSLSIHRSSKTVHLSIKAHEPVSNLQPNDVAPGTRYSATQV
jgi:hypothetical protein